MHKYIELLRNNPNYTRLWMSQAISLLGDWFSTISLSVLAISLSGGSSLAVSGVLLARFLPAVILGPAAGIMADSFDRKKILIFTDLARVVIVLLFLVAIESKQLWVFYLLLILQFSLSAFFEPARSALVPSVVAPKYLVEANLLGSITWSAMLAVGAAIGGTIAATFGLKTAIICDALTFALSALFLFKIKIDYIDTAVKISSDQDHAPRASFTDGLRYILRNPSIGVTLLIKMGGSIGSDDIVMVIYATQFFAMGQNGAGSLGILYGAFGIGAVIGPILIDRLNSGTVRIMRRLSLVGYIFVSLGWFLFGYAPTLYLAAFALFIRAMGSAVYWTYSSVMVQKSSPDRYLGRFFAIDISAYRLATILSIVFTGWFLDQASAEGVRNIIFMIGFASLVPIALLGIATFVIEHNHLEEQNTYDRQPILDATIDKI